MITLSQNVGVKVNANRKAPFKNIWRASVFFYDVFDASTFEVYRQPAVTPIYTEVPSDPNPKLFISIFSMIWSEIAGNAP